MHLRIRRAGKRLGQHLVAHARRGIDGVDEPPLLHGDLPLAHQGSAPLARRRLEGRGARLEIVEQRRHRAAPIGYDGLVLPGEGESPDIGHLGGAATGHRAARVGASRRVGVRAIRAGASCPRRPAIRVIPIEEVHPREVGGGQQLLQAPVRTSGHGSLDVQTVQLEGRQVRLLRGKFPARGGQLRAGLPMALLGARGQGPGPRHGGAHLSEHRRKMSTLRLFDIVCLVMVVGPQGHSGRCHIPLLPLPRFRLMRTTRPRRPRSGNLRGRRREKHRRQGGEAMLAALSRSALPQHTDLHKMFTDSRFPACVHRFAGRRPQGLLPASTSVYRALRIHASRTRKTGRVSLR